MIKTLIKKNKLLTQRTILVAALILNLGISNPLQLVHLAYVKVLLHLFLVSNKVLVTSFNLTQTVHTEAKKEGRCVLTKPSFSLSTTPMEHPIHTRTPLIPNNEKDQ